MDPSGHDLAPASGEGRDSCTSFPRVNWEPDRHPLSQASPRIQEQICGGGARYPQVNLERGVSMAIPPGNLLPGPSCSCLEVWGIAQRWRRGSPLIPPSQILIRFQMADGPPPLPYFHDKGTEAAAHRTLVTLSYCPAGGVGTSLSRRRM